MVYRAITFCFHTMPGTVVDLYMWLLGKETGQVFRILNNMEFLIFGEQC